MSEILDLPNDAYPEITPGRHTLSASLHENDGRVVAGSTGDSIAATVAARCATCTPAPVPSPAAGCVAGTGHLFPETGHTVCPAFVTWWARYGGLAQFGYPITEVVREPDPGSGTAYAVQYFQRARFEYHPDLVGTPSEVLLGRLGAQVQPPAAAVPASGKPGDTFFTQTGHNVGALFFTYWQQHGGLFVNGYPITEAVDERSPTDGRLYRVQYFERARFEYHPELAGTPHEVLLGLLGVQVARERGLVP